MFTKPELKGYSREQFTWERMKNNQKCEKLGKNKTHKGK
jgi:hypothetical protein